MWAPVKAPFSWPKSSLSMRFPGMAPQFMGMKGLFFLTLWEWIAMAMSSFPVPLSPAMRTETSVVATLLTVVKIPCIFSLEPIILPMACLRIRGKAEVKGNEGRMVTFHEIEGLFAILCEIHIIVLYQRPFHLRSDAFVVIYN